MAVDLGVYGRVKTLSGELRSRANEAFQRKILEQKLQEQINGDDPAAVKIVNDMQMAARDAQDVNLSPLLRKQAAHRYSLLNQVAKSFAVDRGMEAVVPDFYNDGAAQPQPQRWQDAMGMPPHQAINILNGQGGQAMPQQANLEDLDAIFPDAAKPMPLKSPSMRPMQTSAVTEVPGYTNIIAGREGAKQQAKKNVDLQMLPLIEEKKVEAKERALATSDAKKKGIKADNALDILGQAEMLLPKASEGWGGAISSAAKGAAGMSDQNTQANEQLRLLSGWLVSNVPRMEGPQSDFDVQNYRTMAADLGNITKPIGDRLAALQGLRALQQKYATAPRAMAPQGGGSGGWNYLGEE
jgi:hypothetical protein